MLVALTDFATEFTAFYSEQERETMGLTKLLPTSLDEALKELENDWAWATSVLGQEYVEWFMALKKAEIETLSKMNVKERRLMMLNLF